MFKKKIVGLDGIQYDSKIDRKYFLHLINSSKKKEKVENSDFKNWYFHFRNFLKNIAKDGFYVDTNRNIMFQLQSLF